MFNIDTAYIKNWAMWSKAKVDFSHRGATFLRGKSKDANGNSNFAGKSTLVNAMYALIHGDHQLAVRKNSLKTISSKDTYLRLDGRVDNHAISMRLAKGKLSVIKDARDLEIHKQASARDVVSDMINIPPELWSSTVHVNGIASNPLIRGTGAKRCAFLENAFQLNRWTNHFAHVSEALSAYRRVDVDLKDALIKLESLGAAVDISKLEARAHSTKDKLGSVAKSISRIEKMVATVEALPDKPKHSSDHYSKLIKAYEKKLSDLDEANVCYTDYVHASRAYTTYIRAKEELQEKINSVNTKLTSEEIRESLQKLKADIEASREYNRNKRIIATWYKIASGIAKSHGIMYEDAQELRALSKSWIAALRPGSKKCPVCGSKFKRTIDREHIEALKEAYQDLPDDIKKVNVDLDEAVAKHKALQSKFDAVVEAEDARRELKSLKKVEKVEAVDKPKANSTEIASMLSALKISKQNAESWENSSLPADHSVDLDKLKQKVRTLIKERNSLDSTLQALNTDIDRAKSTDTLRQHLQDTIAKLEKEKKLQPVYKAMQAAYSPSGLRLTLLYEILEAIISNLNSNSFTGKTREVYGYKLTKSRDLTFTASNMKGTYDVRYLSGAEAGLFCVNLLLTILPMLPSNSRTSLLILDEIEANMSADTRDILAREYIPRLLDIVPSLWIVTPCVKAEFYVPNARELLVTKHNGTSTLSEVS